MCDAIIMVELSHNNSLNIEDGENGMSKTTTWMTEQRRTNVWAHMSNQDKTLLKMKAVEYGMNLESLIGKILRQWLEDEPPMCRSWSEYIDKKNEIYSR